jgi:hypothetical protein
MVRDSAGPADKKKRLSSNTLLGTRMSNPYKILTKKNIAIDMTRGTSQKLTFIRSQVYRTVILRIARDLIISLALLFQNFRDWLNLATDKQGRDSKPRLRIFHPQCECHV